MTQPTFYWHDYETWGANPQTDRPAQFAGLRTTLDFEPVGRPLTIYCQPTPDFLPHPQAVMITGITPQHALAQGMNEAAFAEKIAAQMSEPNTTIIGYNNISFDDEVTRHLFYRNFTQFFWDNALRVLPAVTRLTIHRRLPVVKKRKEKRTVEYWMYYLKNVQTVYILTILNKYIPFNVSNIINKKDERHA